MTHIFHTVSHHYQPIPLVIGASTFHTPLKNFSFFFACLSSPHDRTGSTSSRASGHRPAHSYWPAPVSPSMCAIFKLAPCRGSNICLAKDGSGAGSDRVSADFGFNGFGFGARFSPAIFGFGYPIVSGFGADF
jgi:hypothetical protein